MQSKQSMKICKSCSSFIKSRTARRRRNWKIIQSKSGHFLAACLLAACTNRLTKKGAEYVKSLSALLHLDEVCLSKHCDTVFSCVLCVADADVWFMQASARYVIPWCMCSSCSYKNYLQARISRTSLSCLSRRTIPMSPSPPQPRSKRSMTRIQHLVFCSIYMQPCGRLHQGFSITTTWRD